MQTANLQLVGHGRSGTAPQADLTGMVQVSGIIAGCDLGHGLDLLGALRT